MPPMQLPQGPAGPPYPEMSSAAGSASLVMSSAAGSTLPATSAAGSASPAASSAARKPPRQQQKDCHEALEPAVYTATQPSTTRPPNLVSLPLDLSPLPPKHKASHATMAAPSALPKAAQVLHAAPSASQEQHRAEGQERWEAAEALPQDLISAPQLDTRLLQHSPKDVKELTPKVGKWQPVEDEQTLSRSSTPSSPRQVRSGQRRMASSRPDLFSPLTPA